MSRASLILGDVSDVLPRLPAGHFDAVLCDPPYGISFMGRRWDHGVPSSEVWREVLRVLKPGAPLLAFGGTRTYHRLAVAIEDAGLEISDSILCAAWVHGQGFPKSLDVSKAIDRAAGAEREVVGPDPQARRRNRSTPQFGGPAMNTYDPGYDGEFGRMAITAAATPEAARWEGYASALKPSWEPVVCAWKPRSGTYAENAMAHGVGGWNVDGGRIASEPWSKKDGTAGAGFRSGKFMGSVGQGEPTQAGGERESSSGRYPSNLILSHHPECRRVGQWRVATGTAVRHRSGGNTFGSETKKPPMEDAGYADPDGTETIPAWDCHEACPVAALDRQSGELTTGTYTIRRDHAAMGYRGGRGSERQVDGDSGGASRFYFQATWDEADHAFLQYHSKASTAERNTGMPAGERCLHPTIKPVSLLAYLARLILPPARDGEPRRLLVPFAGAGSEIIGALRAGWEEVAGIELEAEHVRWAELRILGDAPLLNQVERIDE